MSLLQFQQVGYWYKNKSQPLFQDINISFQKGKFYTIVGTSGTGKTTFLSLAGGLDAPKEGNILYIAKEYLEGDEITIVIKMAEGDGNGRAWGCDLTYDYIKINASYRT